MIAVLRDLIVQTLTNPRYALRGVLQLVSDRQARWLAAGLVVILSVILTELLFLVDPIPAGSPFEAMLIDPTRNVITQAVFLVLAAWAMSGVGRWFGGVATFGDSLLAVTWIEFVLLVLQVAQAVIVLALPFLGLPLAALTIALFFWLLTHFTAGLNGFTSMPKTFAGVMGTTVIGGMIAVFVLSLTGLVAPPVPV
jgi:hypothetical protein